MRRGGVLLVGDVIDDVLVRPSGPIAPDTDTPSRIERTAGGSAANTACWLASEGVPATLVATVGADDLARHAALLEQHGVRARLSPSASPTGTIVVLSQGEQRAMLTDRGANTETGPHLLDDGLLAEHDHLHLAGHALAGEDRDAGWRDLLARAAALGLTRSVAPGSSALLAGFGGNRFAAVVDGTELLVAGLDEAVLLTGEADPAAAGRRLAAAHATVVVTLGADGALVVRGADLEHVPAAATEAADVTGAGDAFLAGLLAGLDEGTTPAHAAQRGARLAARAVALVGARPR